MYVDLWHIILYIYIHMYARTSILQRNTGQLRLVRSIRLARALRSMRVMRLFRYVGALRTLVLSIISTWVPLAVGRVT